MGELVAAARRVVVVPTARAGAPALAVGQALAAAAPPPAVLAGVAGLLQADDVGRAVRVVVMAAARASAGRTAQERQALAPPAPLPSTLPGMLGGVGEEHVVRARRVVVASPGGTRAGFPPAVGQALAAGAPPPVPLAPARAGDRRRRHRAVALVDEVRAPMLPEILSVGVLGPEPVERGSGTRVVTTLGWLGS